MRITVGIDHPDNPPRILDLPRAGANQFLAYNLTYIPNYLDGALPVDRFVFEPYIPL